MTYIISSWWRPGDGDSFLRTSFQHSLKHIHLRMSVWDAERASILLSPPTTTYVELVAKAYNCIFLHCGLFGAVRNRLEPSGYHPYTIQSLTTWLRHTTYNIQTGT